MSDDQESPTVDVESAFSDDEKSEIRAYIDTIATQNRISPDQAKFDRKGAKPGYLIPLIVNGGAILLVLAGVLLLRGAFSREEATVRAESLEFTSIEGRLIRELQQESQQQILAKEQEIETVRQQLQELEREQDALEADIETRLAEREEELREQLAEEIAAERARLIADGIEDAEIEELLAAFEAERRAFYERRLAEFRAELEDERVALQQESVALRDEYQTQLAELQAERQQIADEFRRREEDLRVQLEQRSQVLELARVEATADLEAAQRELAALERSQENTQAVQNQVIGQIESIETAIVAGNDEEALSRIGALVNYLSQDEVIQLEAIGRRRDMDLFLLGQLQTLVEGRTAAESGGERSITQELRFLSQIRTLSETAAGAPSETAQREAFTTLLQTLPQVAEAHTAVVARERDDAIEEARESEREIVDQGTASAATLAAQGAYDEAAEAYVEALEALPSVAPEAETILAEILRLGYAITEYVVDDEESAQVQEIARRAEIDLEAERQRVNDRIQDAIDAAVNREDAGLGLIISQRDDRIEELESEIEDLTEEIEVLTGSGSPAVIALREERAELITERDSLENQRDQLVTERAALRARYTEYANTQAEAIASGDVVALADARDQFFLSDEVSVFLEGLGDLIDEYEQQVTAEQTRIGLDVRDVSDIVEELSIDLTQSQRSALLENARATATADGDAAMIEFLTLLQTLITSVEASS